VPMSRTGRAARRRSRLEPARQDHPAVIVPPTVLYAIAFVAGLLIDWLIPKTIAAPATISPIGFAILAVGALLAVWGRRTMEGAGTNLDPRLPVRSLVVSGPFRFSRNPLYVARTLLYVGLALMMNTAWPLLALLPALVIVHYGVIRREEQHLTTRFGAAYAQYQAQVRRWL